MMTRIDVGLPGRRYPILIGSGLLDDATGWRDAIRGIHALIVSDSNVAPLYAQRLCATLTAEAQPLAISTLVLPIGEEHKNLEAVAQVLDALAQLGATRDACVLA
ncbi:MAG: 3-dehydroquinate synthase, partial [Rhodanobacteraceae bacterium]